MWELGRYFAGLVGVLGIALTSGCGLSRTLEIETRPPGAAVWVNGKELGEAPVKTRASWGGEKDIVRVRAELEGYAPAEQQLGRQDARGASNPWVLELELAELRTRRTLQIESNVEEAQVRVNGQELKKGTPTEVTLVFVRDSAADEWSTATVDVRKDRYQHQPEDGAPRREFSAVLSPDNFPSDGRMRVELRPVQFYLGTIKRFVFTGEGTRTQEETVLSQVGEIETEPRAASVTMVSDLPSELPLFETSLSVTPEGGLVYSMPVWRPGEDAPVGANLWLQNGVQKTRLTDGEYFDAAASVTSDGQWVYFSSDRSGRRCIHRIQTNGKGGIGQITDSPSSDVDHEPTLSPDGKRLAFTSLPAGGKVPQILFCNADGTLRTQSREGRQAAWSPDGKTLAYVAANTTTGNDAIWLMDADGSNPRSIAFSADCNYGHPAWTRDGQSILYEADKAVNAALGTRQFDIWEMKADGTGARQLTTNGSYDVFPAVTPDGGTVYFLSNRGVEAEMQNNLQVWSMELLERR